VEEIDGFERMSGMSPVTEQLLEAALALSEEERFELVEALLSSQGSSDESTLDPAWLVEVQRRSAEIDSGQVQLTPWNVVRDRVRQRLEGLSNG